MVLALEQGVCVCVCKCSRDLVTGAVLLITRVDSFTCENYRSILAVDSFYSEAFQLALSGQAKCQIVLTSILICSESEDHRLSAHYLELE